MVNKGGRPKGSKNRPKGMSKEGKEDIAKRLAARLDTEKAIEAASFAGLTYMYAEGPVDWMMDFFTWLTGTPVEEKAETMADIAAAMADIIPDPSGQMILLGYSIGLKATKKEAEKALVVAEIKESTTISQLEATRKALELQLEIAHKMTDPAQRQAFEDEIQKKIDKADESLADRERKRDAAAAEFERAAFLLKWATALGMAGTTRWFLREYSTSEAIEAMSFVE